VSLPAKVGVLLVHGIGAQRPGSLTKAWAEPIKTEIDRILREQERRSREAESVYFSEYLWDPQVRAFSGLAVTAWTLMNLPLIAAIHTGLSFEARPESQYSEKPQHLARQGVVRFWIAVWRGVLTPLLVMAIVIPLWIINPPVVIISGVLSLLVPRSWRPLRLGWRPIRPANYVMTRIVGDAYMWLASPVSRLFSRGSREGLVQGFTIKLEELYKECSRVVIVAHSQGAAIAVAALQAEGVLRRPTHLVTVGGGHRLLQGIHASRQSVGSSALSNFYFGLGIAVLAQVLWFQYLYIGSLFTWFIVTPLLGLRGITASLAEPGAQAAIGPGWGDLLFRMLGKLMETASSLALTLMLACCLSVILALYAFGRPRTSALELGCGWTEVWSRFDPVCTGPVIDVTVPPMGSVVSLRRTHKPCVVETWILKFGLPVLEHVSYFTPGSSSLRVIAMSIVWQLNAHPVQVMLPGPPQVIRHGLAWIASLKVVITVCFLLSAFIVGGIVWLIVRYA
jgi:hypothetical protein